MGELEAERVRDVRVDLERVAQAQLPVLETGLLEAIADGTFGLMKRPADGGKGLDGVAKKAKAYYNPATEILEGQS